MCVGSTIIIIMAVTIMSASLLLLCLLQCFLQVLSRGEVFRTAPQAHTVLLRSKRANLLLLEEIFPGNLERECNEERCNFEEARECFEDIEKTNVFWTIYFDGDQCQSNPCLNGGNCTDKVGGFSCSCSAPYYGPACEWESLEKSEKAKFSSSAPQFTTPEVTECPTKGPNACHQLCTASHETFYCSCTSGFKLQSDGRSCAPEVKFPCGRVPEDTASLCPDGKCPWQVSLVDRRLQDLCGGVVLGEQSILTTARCLYLDSEALPPPSNFFVHIGKRKFYSVKALYLHNHFNADHHDNDLAIVQLATPLTFSPTLIHLCLPSKDFSENILMRSGRTGITGSWEGPQDQNLVYMTLEECRKELNVSHQLSNKMFCMRQENAPSGNQNGTQEILEAQRSPNVHLVMPTGAHRSQTRPWWNQGRVHGPKVNRTQDQTQNPQNRTPNRAASHNHSSKVQNPGGNGPCSSLMPGSPVATAERGTVFLTGLLMSTSSDCEAGSGGLVFSKLSRYLKWIQSRVEVAERQMTPQIRLYPKRR